MSHLGELKKNEEMACTAGPQKRAEKASARTEKNVKNQRKKKKKKTKNGSRQKRCLPTQTFSISLDLGAPGGAKICQ